LTSITEIKSTLSGRVDRFVCDLVERSDDRIVVLYRMPAGRDLHGVWLPAGGITVGYFWGSRPYNLYHWLHPDGRTIAYYFNVGDVVRLEEREFEWHDLAVDVLATPGGRVSVLDEDELPSDLDEATRRYVEAARDEILRDMPRLTAEAERESQAILRRLNVEG
jgi:predicted RNA-binding protein associated with RNAse of E/G family